MRVKISFSLFACLLISFQCIFGQTTKTVGSSGADYPNLTTAFQAVNDGTLTGNITFQITSSITEPTGNGPRLIGKGDVGAVDITSGGTGYNPGDSVFFSAPGGGGRQARGIIFYTDGYLTGAVLEVLITDQGSGYTSAPTVSFGGSGSGAVGTAAIGGNYNSITIYPTAAGLTISCNAEWATLNLLGADNVTIDGRVNRSGSTSDLTIVNTNSAATYAIFSDCKNALRLSADATNNVFRYVTFKSSYDPGFITGGLSVSNLRFSPCILFGRGITAGNSNNLIENCKITKNGSSGVVGLLSDGYPTYSFAYPINPYSTSYQYTPVGSPNENNIIRNNDFFDLVKEGMKFLYIKSNSENWTIEGNSFYQTAPTTIQSGSFLLLDEMIFAIESGFGLGDGTNNVIPCSGFTIRNNYFGGSQPHCAGAAWTETRLVSGFGITPNYNGCYFEGISGTIEGNIFKNMEIQLPASALSFFNLIGSYNTGHSGANVLFRSNTVGDSTDANSVRSSASSIYGVFSIKYGRVDIDSNRVLGLRLMGSSPNFAQIKGIVKTNSEGRLSDNTIYKLTIPSTRTGSGQLITGIEYDNLPEQGPDSISNNKLSDFTIEYPDPGESSITGIRYGLYGDTKPLLGYFLNNTIHDLTGFAVGSGSRINGILGSGLGLVSGNKVYGLRNANTSLGLADVGVYGIDVQYKATVEKNHIYDLHIDPSGTQPIIIGIRFQDGGNINNNFIGLDDTSSAVVIGINAESDQGSVVNNTVRIAGQTSTGSSVTSCITSSLASGVTGSTSFIRSNIFSNTRSNADATGRPNGATGIHRAIELSAIPDNIDYNDYFYDSVSMPLGYFQGIDKSTLSDWRLTTLQDCHSITLNPQFTNSNMSNSAGYYPNEQKLRATPEAGVTEDFFGSVRSNTAPAMGAYERSTTVLDNATVTITSVTPGTVSIGGTLGIKGTNFIGVTDIKMNGASAHFIVISEDSISVIVPSCALGGNSVKVITTCSEAQWNSLVVLDSCLAPHIDSISPDPAGFGSWVRIYGSSLDRVTSAKINGVSVDSIDLQESCIYIRVLLPFTANSGNLSITSICGSDSMALSVIAPVPNICCASIFADCGGPGTDLSNFTDLNVAAGKVPSGAILTWHTDSIASAANQVANPAAVPNGVYYAAYYFSSYNYYSPTFLNGDGSGSTVAGLCISLNIECPDSTFNAEPYDGFTFTAAQQAVLDQVYTSFSASCGCYTDPNYLGWFSSQPPNFYDRISDLTALAPGTYYLHFAGFSGYYDFTFSDPIVVTIAGCPPSIPDTFSFDITCPDTTFDADPNDGFSFTPAQQAILDSVYNSVFDNCYCIPEGPYWYSAQPTNIFSPQVSDLTALAPGTYYLTYMASNDGGLFYFSDPIIVIINPCDSGTTCTDVWYADLDGDGYSSGDTVIACTAPEGYYAADSLQAIIGDCNDDDSTLNPATVWYKDSDNDGYSDSSTQTQCERPDNYKLPSELTSISGDCNDSDSTLNPQTLWYKDADNDGYSDSTTQRQCTQPTGFKRPSALIALSGDCNDNDSTLNPQTLWYKDSDNDGYSDGTSKTQCTRPTGYKKPSELTATSGDCNDNNASIKPGVTEVCGDGIDNNCNGQTDEGCSSGCNFVTYSQGGWAARNSPLTASFFASKFPTGIYIGASGRSILLTSTTAVKSFLPNSGTAARLTQNWTNPTNKQLKNTFAGQLVALKINMAYNPELAAARISSTDAYNGWTVQQLFDEANSKISSSSAVSSTILTSLSSACDKVNLSYDKGVTGYVVCSSTPPGIVGQSYTITGGNESSISVELFPNPARNYSMLQVKGLDAGASATVRVMNLAGQKLSQPFTLREGETQKVGEALLPGVYLIEVQSPSGRKVVRFVKQ